MIPDYIFLPFFSFYFPESQKSRAEAPEACAGLAPGCVQAAAGKSATPEYFSCVSSPSKHVLVEKTGKAHTKVTSETGTDVQLGWAV